MSGEWQRVAERSTEDVLDAGDYEPDFAELELILEHALGCMDAQHRDFVILAGRQHADLLTFLHRTVDDTHQRHDAQIVVEPRVDDQRLQLGVRITFRSEEHTSELQSLMRISYAVFCLKKKNHKTQTQ